MGENGAYVYSPLEAGSFRLLKFAPTESEDGLVEVELSTFPLVNTPPFNVLSYRWGLSTTWRYLYCHGQKIRLRQSALDAIVAVRSRRYSRDIDHGIALKTHHAGRQLYYHVDGQPD